MLPSVRQAFGYSFGKIIENRTFFESILPSNHHVSIPSCNHAEPRTVPHAVPEANSQPQAKANAEPDKVSCTVGPDQHIAEEPELIYERKSDSIETPSQFPKEFDLIPQFTKGIHFLKDHYSFQNWNVTFDHIKKASNRSVMNVMVDLEEVISATEPLTCLQISDGDDILTRLERQPEQVPSDYLCFITRLINKHVLNLSLPNSNLSLSCYSEILLSCTCVDHAVFQ